MSPSDNKPVERYDSGYARFLKGGGGLAPIRYILAGLLGGTMLLGLLYCLAWRWRHREPLIPPQRRGRFVPWSGLEVTLVLLLYVGIPMITLKLFETSGFLKPVANPKTLTIEELKPRMLIGTLLAPLILILSAFLLRKQSNTKLRHIGLSRWRWRHYLTLGYYVFFIITPTVLGLSYTAEYVSELQGLKSHPHPLQLLAESGPGPFYWLLIVVQPVVAAPILEEFVFRGIMLPWLSQRWWGGWAAMAGGIAIGLAMVDESRTPLAFALAVSLLGIAFTFPHRGEQWARRAIIGTAILFAMVHANVWPTPIPLLVLGLALGWAAHRTRSLITPIVLHSLFNAVATLMLLTGFPSHTKGKLDTSAPKRPEAASISIIVPGVWWP